MLFAPVAVRKERTVDPGMKECSYCAVLKKRCGKISAEDFLRFSQRFVMLCNEIHKDYRISLVKNMRIPTGAFFAASDCGEFWNIPFGGGEVEFPHETINPEEFSTFFQDALSLSMSVLSTKVEEDMDFVRASVQWTWDKPSSLFFHAQQGPVDQLGQDRTPLHDLLLRRMFHLPGQPPCKEFALLYGSMAYGLELEGNFYPQGIWYSLGNLFR